MVRSRSKARRPYRSGGIWRDPKSGRLLAGISLPDGTRHSKWFATAPEANIWLEEEWRAAQSGQIRSPRAAKVTVEEWVADWVVELRKCAARGKSAQRKWGTLAGYEDKFQWMTRAYGRHRVEEITPKHIEALHDWLRRGVVPPNQFGAVPGTQLSAKGGPLKVQGIIHLHHYMKPMFRRAYRDHLIRDDPTYELAAPGIPAEEKFVGEALDIAIWRKAIELAQAVPNGLAVLIAAMFGTRRGEHLGLTWEDVVLEGRLAPYLTITQTLQRQTREGLVRETAKT